MRTIIFNEMIWIISIFAFLACITVLFDFNILLNVTLQAYIALLNIQVVRYKFVLK